MEFLLNHITSSLLKVVGTFSNNWPFLLVSIVIAVLLKQYLNPERVSGFLRRYQGAGVLAATAAAVTTPLCSCGTTAIILGMMAGSMPWAPIVAFMVASPLTSPEELIYSAGLFGWPFALAFFIASIVLGLLGGAVAAWMDSKGWLRGQARLQRKQACSCTPAPVPQAAPLVLAPAPATCCSSTVGTRSYAVALSEPACACSAPAVQPVKSLPKVDYRLLGSELFQTGWRLLVMFFGFAFIGYFLNSLIPVEWVAAIFGSGQVYGVPLAATLGLPLYINTEASLPLVRALLDSGMSQGAALAFLITGAGTSFGAVAGALTIARWRVIAVVVGTLWVGAIVVGVVYNLLGV